MSRARNLSALALAIAGAVYAVWEAAGWPTDGEALSALIRPALAVAAGVVWGGFLRRPHDVWRATREPQRGGGTPRFPGGRSGLSGLALLAALALPALADAQPAPGVGWQSGSGEIRYGFPQAPSCTSPRALAPQFDPWTAAGDPTALRPLDLAAPAVRQAYGLRYGATPAELDSGIECWRGGMNGAPHGVGAEHRLIEAFAAGKLGAPSAWTGTPNHREIEDVTNSGGEWCRLLAMVGLTCAAAGGPADGYHRGALLELPMEWRPPNTRGWPSAEVRLLANGPEGACAWMSLHARRTPPEPAYLYVIRNRPPCFAGLPADCQTVASLRPECWAPTAPPEPEPPTGPALAVLDCDATGWRVRTAAGESRVALGAVVTVEGVAVSLPAACPGACPAAEVIERVRAEVCE